MVHRKRSPTYNWLRVPTPNTLNGSTVHQYWAKQKNRNRSSRSTTYSVLQNTIPIYVYKHYSSPLHYRSDTLWSVQILNRKYTYTVCSWTKKAYNNLLNTGLWFMFFHTLRKCLCLTHLFYFYYYHKSMCIAIFPVHLVLRESAYAKVSLQYTNIFNTCPVVQLIKLHYNLCQYNPYQLSTRVNTC